MIVLGLTGSIGVYTVHQDFSGANAKAGVGVTYVFAGERKVDGNPDSPLSPAAAASMQQMVDDFYGLFVGAVVALLGGIVVLVTSGSGLGIGLLVAGGVIGVAGVLVLRSISPEERARLTAPKPEPDA